MNRDNNVSKGASENLGDVPAKAFREQLHQLADWIADYRENISGLPVAPTAAPGSIQAALPKHPPEDGESFEQIFTDFKKVIMPGIVHWGHPSFMGYFGSTTTAPGIEGEILASVLNINAMTWRTSPAATELETVVVDWLRQWLGLPDEFGGVVYDTASIGIMHALAVAREQAGDHIRGRGLAGRKDIPRLTVYTSDQTHSSVEKAVIALGLGEENVRRVPSDPDFRINLSAFREMIVADLRDGIKPLAAVATVGTTSTASVDPVPDMAEICREHKLWLHIDGAYGAGLALLPEFKWITLGWDQADSIVVNPHKMLFVPFDFSVLYMRNIERLRRVFTLVPDYLRGDTIEAEKNYMDYGVQLGRKFRALKAWMVFRTFGRRGIAARIREHMRMANLLAQWIKEDNRFELAAPVVMGVICFRLVRDTPQKSDEATSAIVENINASGLSYLTQTKLHGRVAMRVGLGNILTTEQDLRNLWRNLQDLARL